MGTTTRGRGGVVAAVLCVGLIAAGCGSDSKSADSTTTAASKVSTENAAFCTKFMEADAAVNQLQSGSGSPDATNTALADAQKAAPAALTDTVDSLVTGMKTFLASPEAQQSQNGPPDDVTNSYYDVVKWMSGNCGYQDVAVKAQEYKYIGMPESLDAGPTLVSLTNEGSEFHEVVIIKKKPGTTETAEEIIALPQEEAMTKVDMVTTAFAEPGKTAWASATLTPGDYIFACFIPVGFTPEAAKQAEKSGEEPQGEPHALKGMVHEFTIK